MLADKSRETLAFLAGLVIAGLIIAAVALAIPGCSGTGWRKAGEVGADVAECTIERLIEQERRRGHTALAARLEVVAREAEAAPSASP